MNRSKMLLAVISLIAVSLIITCVAANPLATNTPLYTYRMEQASSEMNFLPIPISRFAYNTEKGYTLSYEVGGCCNDTVPLVTGGVNTCDTCEGIPTCPETCEPTCEEPTCYTCPETCSYTCPSTCNDTCTSPYTCKHSTCAPTCNDTCTSPWTCYQSGC